MKAFSLLLLLFSSSAMALTFTTDDQQSALVVNGKFKYQLGALNYQWLDASQAQAIGGNDQFSISITGAHRLNESVTLIGEMGWDILSDSVVGDQLYADQAWLGIRFNETLEVTVGRSERPFTQVTDMTDVFNIFGGKGYWFQDATLDDQLKISYYNHNADIRVAYAVNDNNKQSHNVGTKAQYGFSAGYQYDNGLGLVLAYENKISAVSQSDIESMAFGLNYSDPTGIYFGLTVGQTHDQHIYSVRQLRYWESVLSYSMQKMALGVGYNRLTLGDPVHETWFNEYILAAEYYLIPQAKIYAEWLVNDIDGMDNLYGVGMEYYF
ncbi:MAG: porin [Oceanisphaera sp.]